MYALTVAESMMKTGAAGGGYVIVVGCECLSRITDYTDRSTCVLFGDGAGAAVLAPSEDDSGMLASSLYSDGGGASLLYGDSHRPVIGHADGTVSNNDEPVRCALKMHGGEILKFTVRIVPEMVDRVLHQANMTKDDIDYYLFHQANLRLIASVKEKFGIPDEKVPVNIERYGNTSSASVPILLDEINRQGRLKKGDLIVAVGFGAGLTAGSVLLRW